MWQAVSILVILMSFLDIVLGVVIQPAVTIYSWDEKLDVAISADKITFIWGVKLVDTAPVVMPMFF
jgi:hypothetical protein